MAFTEVYSALETKTVDGQENPFISVDTNKFYDVQKYASNTRHAYSPLLVLAGKKFWDQLSNDERTILMGAANEAKRYLESGAAVDGHLADQLLLPMALGGGGVFTTARVSQHTRTNADVIRRFLEVPITIDEGDPVSRIRVG